MWYRKLVGDSLHILHNIVPGSYGSINKISIYSICIVSKNQFEQLQFLLTCGSCGHGGRVLFLQSAER